MKTTFVLPLLMCLAATGASAASMSRSYSYFPIGGLTLPEIESQLRTRGPKLESTGTRHPGATNLEFNTSVDYVERDGRCRVSNATVSVKAKVTLPRWRNRNRAKQEVRLIWDTLAKDIKRHEESHLSIAKNHARQLEDAIGGMVGTGSCSALEKRVQAKAAKVLAQHDAAQERFDRIESINFESRIMRLLRYRLEQIEAGRLK
ncbi:DUF922 domain-containing Zn-dependent protease [Nitratireductor luteus]|uniref:DUF922 domain-containing Zn-dependent protease n=1 Tax=Nitratireductor luteus TaxID=2976980 RepID=UPI002240D13E|nr:DUF922 domain-containing protein [Nitratireductor luteus]